ncbi:hypothetical protein P171DRAFT_441067 [Karstenula rhodostoma CBS 690.94]|uniref:Uncharacterized protein n=1 Tax=Karstenula rhodostoma CBS 690.94 TaxID=1392251 RepID=A0A9P4PT15_9PLEO|nr:hypothetical protein P171DRAFT_441067 [Karstenula rhodostoma CBS 690.94]
MPTASNDMSNDAPLSAISLPAELRNQIHEYLAADVAANGVLHQYSGYMLCSKQTYQEVSSIILENLNNTLAAVENGYYKQIDAILKIDKPTNIPYDQTPFGPLLDIHCSSLVFYLYDDPAWASLSEGARNSSYQTLEFNIKWICKWVSSFRLPYAKLYNLRATTQVVSTDGRYPKRRSVHRMVNAPMLKFEWGLTLGSEEWQAATERIYVQDCCPAILIGGPRWRYQIYRSDGTTTDIKGVVRPERLIEPVMPGRVPTIGIVLNRIESQGIVGRLVEKGVFAMRAMMRWL